MSERGTFGRYSVLAIFSGALFFACGLAGLGVAGRLGSQLSGNVNLYLQLWGGSGAILVAGAILMFITVFFRPGSGGRSVAAGSMGFLISLFAAVDAYSLVTGVEGASIVLTGLESSLVVIGALLVVFLGFPLGVASSLSVFFKE